MQSELAHLMIQLLIGPIPAVVLIAAAIGAMVYPPMTREAHEVLLERLQKPT